MPVLRAVFTEQGTLTIRGDGWNPCGAVRVHLAQPLGDALALLNGSSFVLEYPKPCSPPEQAARSYRGRVYASQVACGGNSGLSLSTVVG